MRKLARPYSVEIDSMGNSEWYALMKGYEDASIYQAASYGRARYGVDRISRLVLWRNGEPVAAAQCGILEPPVIGKGMAHLRWGPLWRRKGGRRDAEDFRQVIRALRNEYACRRGLFLRVYPRISEEERKPCEEILLEEGFWPWEIGHRDRTFVIDLGKDIHKLREETDRKWRRHLERAEQRGLEQEEGTQERLFEEFGGIYRDMQRLRRASPNNDLERFRRAQAGLPEDYRMRVFLCRRNGVACAGIIASAIGSVGLTMFRASSGQGRKFDALYLVQWRALQWLKEAGCTGYDTDGISPLRDPEACRNKAGLCGCNRRDVFFLGQFETCTQESLSTLLKPSEQTLRAYRRARQGFPMRRFA